MIEIPGYSILRTLGQGGMAVVYLAVQHSLGREVALKVLSPALADDPVAKERFLREARYAAKLQHPNIVAVHDVGTSDGIAYMAIAYEPGGSLASSIHGPVEPARALRIVRDVAAALDYAHRRGVVHRDVKPHNILLRDDGTCVLGDFGIALALEPQTRLTDRDAMVGTPHYMSPEQLRGEQIDGRSDLYSLGVVLYELLTGRLPYEGTDGWAIGMQHLSARIPRLPDGLSRLQPLVDASMAKSVDERPRSGSELVERIDATHGASTLHVPAPQARVRASRRLVVGIGVASVTVGILVAIAAWNVLRPDVPPTSPRPSTAAVERRPSIVVLPFADLSESQDQSYFSDGIAEELTTVLAQLPQIDVVSRTSAASYKGRSADVATIGRELGVGHVLEGSVRKAGERVRITVQLISVKSGFHLWSQSYDRRVADVFELQDEIAKAVAFALKVRLLPASTSPKPSGDFKSLYADGMAAAARHDWQAVRSHMSAALAAEADPVPRLNLYGRNFVPYVPRLYLGLASARQGDCAGTLESFDDAATRETLEHPVVSARLANEIRELAAAAVECGRTEPG